MRAAKIDGACDPTARPLCHDKYDTLAHGFADQGVELASEIRAAPFAGPGLHVELEKRIPYCFGEIASGEPVHVDPVGERIVAFAANRLALARGERAQKILETAEAAIFPVKLLIGTLQVTEFSEQAEFRFGRKCDVHARRAGNLADFDQAAGQRASDRIFLRAGTDQKSPSSCRREWHRDLELGIVAAAGASIGISPAMVEDILTTRVALEVARHCRNQCVIGGVGEHMARLPAAAWADRIGLLQSGQECVRYKRIVSASLAFAAGTSNHILPSVAGAICEPGVWRLRVRTSVPFGGGNACDLLGYADAQLGHGLRSLLTRCFGRNSSRLKSFENDLVRPTCRMAPFGFAAHRPSQ